MKTTGFVVVIAMVDWAGVARADIINGDFTSFTGGLPDSWIANPAGVPGEKDTSSPDGSAWSFVPFGRIEQGNVGPAMVSGNTYRVSFLAASPQPAFPSADLNVRMFDNTSFDLLGGLDITSGLTATWAPFSFEFTVAAANAGHLMYPYITTGGGVAGIDNIHVSEVGIPEPATVALICSGLIGLLSCTVRGRRSLRVA